MPDNEPPEASAEHQPLSPLQNEEETGSINWVFHDVMEHLDVGIIVVNTLEQSVIFRNISALDALHGLVDSFTYPQIHKLLLSSEDPVCSRNSPHKQHELRSGNRLLGFSIYHLADNCLCIFIRDITEKSRLMSIAEAVNTMDNIGYIFSGIRHEIGNPINSIKMTMSVLKHKLKDFSVEMVDDYVDRTLSEISRVEFLLTSLRNFSMFENVEVKELDLSSFLEKLLFMAHNDMEKAGITLRAEVPDQPVFGKGDARALQQVLLNLLTNAAGAVENCEHPEIRFELKQGDGTVTIAIHDNGHGISEEEQKHLFKPFFTTKESGTGLGLVICRKMLAQMNSHIEIKSEPGKGTSVIMTLPEGNSDEL